MPFVYLLHLDTPLAHAEHYAGATEHLLARLTTHAQGHGSRLTRRLHQMGFPWRLGALGQCLKTHAWEAEAALKSQHNAPRFCEICHPSPARIPCSTPYPKHLLPFPTDSLSLQRLDPDPYRNATTPRPAPDLVFTRPDSPAEWHTAIKHIMCQDRRALGFIPAGGEVGMHRAFDEGKIIVSLDDDQDVCGYCLFSTVAGRVTIAQCAVLDGYRLQQRGRQMVRAIQQRYSDATTVCKVRTDLPANEFWQALDFARIRTVTHTTSGNELNQYLARPYSEGDL